jgi:EAL domain-containing protein (putative c-di-GMP-specific phosphodiesterase class I)
MVDLVRRELGLNVAFISEIRGDRRTFRALVSDVRLPIEEGFEEPYEDTYCEMITSGRLDEVVPDTSRDPLTAEAFHTSYLGIGSYVGVPMLRSSGELFGTLCAFAPDPRPDLSPAQAEVLRATAVLIMRLIEVEEEVEGRLADVARHVDAALDDVTIDLLPVLEVRGDVVVGHEAFPRFGDGASYRRRLAQAREIGRGVELELAVMTRTLERVEEDGVQVVSCALSLEALRDPAFQAIVAALPPSRMLLRFDVDEPIDDYEELTALLRPLRRLGARVAIDRVGDGAAELRHILLLSPDVLRIDPVLVRGLHADPARRVLVESIAVLADKLDADCVALGVDADADLDWMEELGVTHVVRSCGDAPPA